MIDHEAKTFEAKCLNCGRVIRVVLLKPFTVGNYKPDKCPKCGGTEFEQSEKEVITK